MAADFDAVSEQRGVRGFAMYHKAMALAGLGEFEAAGEIFEAEGSGPLQQTRRGAMARAEVLSQLGAMTKPWRRWTQPFGTVTDPELDAMTLALQAGETLAFTHITSARDGMAEVFYSLAGALRQDAGADYTLLYGRMRGILRPDHVDALLLNADLLETLEQYELANAAYKQVPPIIPHFMQPNWAAPRRLRESGKPDAAIEVLEQLAKRFGDLPLVHSTLGDVLRQQSRFEDAVAAYDRALDLTDEGGSARMVPALCACHFARTAQGMARGRGRFPRALELNPGQPQVLNYLGYSLVEKQIKLDEALEMIEQAVAASPDSGYIVDSLGWVLYRLGRYEEAVGHMERAVELMPVDPVVNDHLGDVYWAVGREREARFQWMRALSFVDPTDTDGEADPVRMRRKLEVGLDAVLAEEGAEPLQVADGD